MQEFKIDKHTTVVAESERTRSGFRHVVILMKDGQEVDRDKVTYQNRTWESFEFETALHSLLKKHPEIPPAKQKAFFERASGREHQRIEQQFHETARVAELGNVFAKTPKERIDWKERMLKAGLPELQLPSDWERLSEKEREERLDRVIEMAKGVEVQKKKKKLKEMT